MEDMLNREVWRIWVIESYGGYAETGGMEDMLNREVWRICLIGRYGGYAEWGGMELNRKV
jgi:hypothetical protein